MAKSLHSHNAAGQVQPLVGKLETQLQLKTQSSQINSKKKQACFSWQELPDQKGLRFLKYADYALQVQKKKTKTKKRTQD